jgi:sec-independent protein translocase protein TatC
MNNLEELKKRALWVLIPYVVTFFTVFSFSKEIIQFLLRYYESNAFALATTESFAVSIRTSLIISTIVLIPLVTYHIYRFISPVYKMKNIFARISLAQILGIEGFVLGSTILAKYVLETLTANQIVQNTYSLANVVNLGVSIGVGTAIALQLILIIPIINSYTHIPFTKGIKKGGYLLIGSYFISAFITPPDLVSTFLVMLPLSLAYIIGLGISQLNYEVKQKC